jgi:hypothetical protein
LNCANNVKIFSDIICSFGFFFFFDFFFGITSCVAFKNIWLRALYASSHLWKTNGRPKNSDNTYTINKKNTTIELRKQCRLEIAEKRMQERQNIINVRSGDSTLFYKLIKPLLVLSCLIAVLTSSMVTSLCINFSSHIWVIISLSFSINSRNFISNFS